MNRFDCSDWADVLDDYLAGRLDGSRLQDAERHLAACPDCRELLVQIRANRKLMQPETDGAELTAVILARTSGSACRRAEELLPDHSRGELEGPDATLLAVHLEHCPDCRRLASTLAWVGPLLAELGAIEPDAAFLGEVLQRTSRHIPRTARLRSRFERFTRDLTHNWSQLWQRPRIAFEAAYVAMLLFVGLFALPASPLRDAPPRALAVVQAGPEQVRTAAMVLAAVPDHTAALGRSAWDAVSGPDSPAGRFAADFAQRRDRAEPVWQRLSRHASALTRQLRRADPAAVADNLVTVTRDVAALWQAWWRSGDKAGRSPATDPSP